VTLPPSFPSPARPDLADRLLAAVAERDLPMADRLVQQWVHRRGLAALEDLIAGPLLAGQGTEAAWWLLERVGEAPCAGDPLGEGLIREAARELEPAIQMEPEWVSGLVELTVEQGLESDAAQRVESVAESADQPISHQAWQASACEEPEVAPFPAAVLSRSWPQLAVLPDGEPAPAPRALAPLRAWLPDADLLPLAS